MTFCEGVLQLDSKHMICPLIYYKKISNLALIRYNTSTTNLRPSHLTVLCTRPPTLSLASINTTRLDESLSFILCCDEVNGYVKLVDKKLKTHELFITYCFATAMPDTPAPTIIISADSSDE